MDLQERNKFTLDAYFTKNYGLPDKPVVGGFNMKLIFVGIIIIVAFVILAVMTKMFALIAGALVGVIVIALPIIKHSKEQSKANEWQADFDYRYNNWDGEYDKFSSRFINDMNLRTAGMGRLGIDEDQVKQAEPFCIQGPQYDGYYRSCRDGRVRTENYQITWLYFSEDQVYMYANTFSLLKRKKNIENTQEFFYTDIVSVATGTVSQSLNKDNNKGGTMEDYTVEAEAFTLTVPGEKMSFAFTSNDGITRSVQGMKNLIRAKKVR